MAAVAEIIDIEADSSAPAGSQVNVRVTLRNKATVTAGIMVGGGLEYGASPWPTISFPVNQANFPPGQSYYFDGYFTMPAANLTLHIYSYYYADGLWHFDDEKTKDVGLAALSPAFSAFQVIDYLGL
ncbi:hypothetical protein ACFLXC_04670 [Chloroflexota bacterium]